MWSRMTPRRLVTSTVSRPRTMRSASCVVGRAGREPHRHAEALCLADGFPSASACDPGPRAAKAAVVLWDRRGGGGARAFRIQQPGSLPGRRSEEHTSELQSLMRISYAVFCLKKKTTNEADNTTSTAQSIVN